MKKGPELNKLFFLGFGHIAAKCATLAAELRLAEILNEKKVELPDVAEKLGFSVDATEKFIRVLAAFDLVIFENDYISQSELTPYLDYFLGTHITDGYKAIDNILYSMKTGQSSWEKTYGVNFYEYLKANPLKLNSFAKWCEDTVKIWLKNVVDMYDFSQFKKIIDVGGGSGELLFSILMHDSNTTGILFDLSDVIQRAKTKFAKINNRVEFVAGDFFINIPKSGDLYIISRTLLNWDADHAKQIINNCFDAMSEKSKLLIIDFVLPDADHLCYQQAVLSDINLYAIMGSSNRTKQEWMWLISSSRFKKFTYYSSDVSRELIMPICIIEAVKI